MRRLLSSAAIPSMMMVTFISLSIVCLSATGGCHTSHMPSESNSDFPFSTDSLSERGVAGEKIAVLEYRRLPLSATYGEHKEAKIFEGGVQCRWRVEPTARSSVNQIYFKPGTAEIRRIDGSLARCRFAEGSSNCSLAEQHVIHGYAWPFEVADEEEARVLSEKRAHAVLGWLGDKSLSENREVEWHGTELSNDERYVTMFEPLGATTGSAFRYVKVQGPPLDEEPLEQIVRLRKLSDGSYGRSTVVPVTTFSHSSELTVNFDAEWLRERGLEFAPEWSVNTTINRGETLLEQWLSWLVEHHCRPTGIDAPEEGNGD